MATTREIFDEMVNIDGGLGQHISDSRDSILYEVNQGDWDWEAYINHVNDLSERHRDFISEFTGGSPRTVCLNDMSIIALAKTLKLPVIRIADLVQSPKRRIPNICDSEDIVHYTFNEFLRLEGYKI